ncbi:MAG: hypothetical protein JW867_01845 [Candidatus Omnitrophica bacterium]|nr:hypothetical protein [Candidatus Omnitrophota bacterium]
MARLTSFLIALFLICCFVSPAYAGFSLGDQGPQINGFAEFSFGGKLGTDSTKKDGFNMLEQRIQLKTSLYPGFNEFLKDSMAELSFKGDFVIDEYYDGKTSLYLRELSLVLSPSDWIDLRVGRQVFTWGTGDYIFINDLFPKDYVSFFIGRDNEYLKKPSDGVKMSLYSKKFNFDFIVLPLFESNTFSSGDRLSFFDSFRSGIASRDSERQITEPDRQVKTAEYACRFYRSFGSFETALYAFRGFYKMPRGYLNEFNRELFYPRLDAYGASIRGPFLGGIANFESGYYNSRQDSKGDNRLIENSSLKYLAGYSRDLGNDLTIGMQYLCEQTFDYDNYRKALISRDFSWDKYRHLTTLRLGKLFKNQTVRADFFVFYSPSDKDGYMRPSVAYDINDRFKITLGANIPWGEDVYTEFGQMKKNKNIFIRARYSF